MIAGIGFCMTLKGGIEGTPGSKLINYCASSHNFYNLIILAVAGGLLTTNRNTS